MTLNNLWSAWTPLGRLLRVPLKVFPDGLPMPVLSGPNRGRRFIKGYGPDGYWLGIVERRMQLLVMENVGPGDVVYDIGANVGLFTLLFSKLVGPLGHVFAFEPSPRVLAGLRAHLALNAVANVTVLPVAISDCQGEARFCANGDVCVGHLDDQGEIVVPTTTLDCLTEQLPRPNAIKMDIEGGEVRALAGGARCLRHDRPKIFLATHDGTGPSCASVLKSSGYHIRTVEERDLLAIPEEPVTGDLRCRAASQESIR